MELNEFMQETDRLEKFYNKELEQYEKDIWFQELKILPAKRYQQIIKKAYTEYKFMPKLADIIEINKQMPYEKKIKTDEKVECKKCKGKGIIIYTKIIQNNKEKIHYDYVARCTCKNGENYNYKGESYYIPTIEQIGL